MAHPVIVSLSLETILESSVALNQGLSTAETSLDLRDRIPASELICWTSSRGADGGAPGVPRLVVQQAPNTKR